MLNINKRSEEGVNKKYEARTLLSKRVWH